MKYLQGFTLIEMMVSIVVASLLSIAVINTYTSQSSMFTIQSQRTRMANDGRDTYEVLSRLLRQAESSSIATSTAGTTLTIDFTIPTGYRVWPNTTAPYADNAIRLQWDSTGSNPSEIRIANGTTIAGLGSDPLNTLVGNTTGSNTQITNLALSQNVSGDYALTITARAGNNGPSASFQGMVMPRN
ncbi:MAG: prepilin-type N-terminal cleavage/methylation domain-containing protein [Ectothiorhodospiraceae bacterium]|nr:prepilin-type N-terminal cleavage/methylation domain-containing protein [Ectothiorhodospiraceae bacterium]